MAALNPSVADRPPMEHELKTWPGPYAAVASGLKPFEVRRSDRPYAVGDTLRLREWDPVSRDYTGSEVRRLVTYILPGGDYGLPADRCVMAIAPMEPTMADPATWSGPAWAVVRRDAPPGTCLLCLFRHEADAQAYVTNYELRDVVVTAVSVACAWEQGPAAEAHVRDCHLRTARAVAADELRTALARAEKRAHAWRTLSELLDKMLVCFRLQRNPGALIDKVRTAREKAAELEGDGA